MPKPPKPCAGSGQPAAHTYTRQARTSGGVVRPVSAANCPVNPDQHYDLPLHDGLVQTHGQ
jgi:hypothetical protein